MTEKSTGKDDNGLKINVSEDIGIVESVDAAISEVVACITYIGGEAKEYIYDDSVSTGKIVDESTKKAGVELEPKFAEKVVDAFEANRGYFPHVKIKIWASLKDLKNLNGGVEIDLEKRPKWEKRTQIREQRNPEDQPDQN